MSEIEINAKEWENRLLPLYEGTIYGIRIHPEPQTPANISVDIFEINKPSNSVIRIWPRNKLSAVFGPELKQILDKVVKVNFINLRLQ